MLDFKQTLNYVWLPAMPGKRRQFIAALAAFFGTTIGVGIFALPYAYSESLTTSLLILAAGGLILISLYTMYIELMLEKGMGLHQLPGIAGKVWGKRAKNIVAIILLFGRTGIMFLYTIILGDFGSLILENVFGLSISPALIATVTTLIASLAITRQVKVMSRIELYLSSLIVSIIGLVSIIGIVSYSNGSGSVISDLFASDAVLDNPSFIDSLRNLGIIYGVTIGAMSGIAAIPALKKISRDKEVLTAATRIGTTLVVVLYALFALFVILSSDTVTPDALHGLGDSWWVTLLAIAGFVSVLTSYLGVGFSLYEVYHQDYLFSTLVSWLLTFAPPVIIFLSGIDNFTEIAAIIGGIIGGGEGIIILATYWRIEEQQRVFPMSKKVLAIVTSIILAIGLALTL